MVPTMQMLFSLILLGLGGLISTEQLRYENYTVYTLTPNSEAAVNILRDWENNRYKEFSFWTDIKGVGQRVDVMVPPHLKPYIQQISTLHGIDMEVMMDNVQHKIDNEGKRLKSEEGTFGWTSYHTLDEINTWLKQLAVTYPNIVKLIQGGQSYEKRPLLGVKLSFKNVSQKAVFFESNIHAREWISSAVCTYILNELLTSKNETIRQIAESHDWYIFPVVNPDGFAYSHTGDRLWRKTRTPYGLCQGADPNRNWDYQWNTGGASGIPCTDTYHGPSAFSEVSTKSLSNFISGIAKDLVAYFAFHSYSQLLLLPYGTNETHLDNYEKMFPVGMKAREVLARRYGTMYDVGNIAEILYKASGVSADWVKSTYHTPIVFTYELRDRGKYGFLLPANQIIPTSEETLDSLLTIIVEGEKVIN